MALRLAPTPPPEPEALADDFDHEFFRSTSLSPIELEAGDEPVAPRSKLRTALHFLGAGVGALAATALCIYALVPNTAEETVVLPGGPELSMIASGPTTAGAANAAPHAEPAVAVPSAPAITAAPVSAATPTTPAAPLRDSVLAAPKAVATTSDTRLRAAHRALARGDANTAIAQARRVVDADATRADAWLVLGSAYDQLKDPRSARLAFRACALRGQGPAVATCNALAR